MNREQRPKKTATPARKTAPPTLAAVAQITARKWPVCCVIDPYVRDVRIIEVGAAWSVLRHKKASDIEETRTRIVLPDGTEVLRVNAQAVFRRHECYFILRGCFVAGTASVEAVVEDREQYRKQIESQVEWLTQERGEAIALTVRNNMLYQEAGGNE